VKQRRAGSLVIDIVRRPCSPTIGAGIVDVHLVGYVAETAYDPYFVVQNKPVAALAQAIGCWQHSDCAPAVRGWIIGELRSRRCAATYHVDLTVIQHTRHVTLTCRPS